MIVVVAVFINNFEFSHHSFSKYVSYMRQIFSRDKMEISTLLYKSSLGFIKREKEPFLVFFHFQKLNMLKIPRHISFLLSES